MSQLEFSNVWKEYGDQVVLERLNLSVEEGEFCSIVGASGCGKTTFLRMLLGEEGPSRGSIELDGKPLPDEPGPDRGVVFQRYSVFPHLTVLQNVMLGPELRQAPLSGRLFGRAKRAVRENATGVLASVGLDASAMGRLPHQFSSGQRQRISIARALLAQPDLIVADEAVSALDVSVQAVILNLLKDLRAKEGAAYLMISHDLEVISYLSDWIVVMYLGAVAERGNVVEVFHDARHPYTQALLSAIPKLGVRKSDHIKLKGEVPTPIHLPSGCVFHGRCIHADDRCRRNVPVLRHLPSGSYVACHAVEEGRI